MDFSIFILLKKLFKLNVSKLEIVMLSMLSAIPQIVYIFCELWVGYYFLMKIAFLIFISIFIVDEFKFKRILVLFAFGLILMFSVYGFGKLFVLYIRALFFEITSKKLGVLYDIVIVLGLICYIILLTLFFTKLSKKQKLENLLAKVSFSVFGRHIEITGLIDSGNTLVDTKTKKPVIIVPLSVIKKYISESEYKMILEKNYFGLDISHELEYVSVGGVKGTMPITDIGDVKIKIKGKIETFKCVVGIVKENLTEDKDYECLLHRDFL